MEMELARRANLYRQRIKETKDPLEKRFYEGKLACLTDMMYLLMREKEGKTA